MIRTQDVPGDGGQGWRAWVESAREFAGPRILETAGIVVLAALLWLGCRWALRRGERWLSERTATKVDDLLARLLRRLLLIGIGFWVAWRLATIWELPRLADAVVAAWIVVFSFPLAAFVGDAMHLLEERVASHTETRVDDTALPLVNTIARFLVVATSVLVALEYLGIDITPLLAGAGVIGLAVSLAAKDTLSNLIAGILLVLDRPFQVGDRIELWTAPEGTGTWGDVVEIGLRATKIRNPDNLLVVIPNNEIMKRDIVNYTASGSDIRLRLPIGVSYDADTTLAKELVLEEARRVEGVKTDPEPVVIVRGFGDSGVHLELRVWIENARRRRAIGDELTGRIKDAFDARGIEIPYPKRDIYVRTEATDKRAPDEGGTSPAAEGLP